MPRARPEAALQRQVMAYLAVALPDDAVATAFPAGGGGKVRGAQLKAMGLMAGWPDVQILWRCQPGHWDLLPQFIGIELKSKVGRLSDEQKACHARIRAAGGEVEVCRSVEEVERVLREACMPLRATVVSPNVYMRQETAA